MGLQFVNAEAAQRSGERVGFSFGANWQKYLDAIDETRLSEAQQSLVESFGGAELAGKRFVDLGSGSGIFSLCALRLGASEVLSIDYDPNSVECARRLKERYGNEAWTVERGSALDAAMIGTVEPRERVYSWGVLHHTGAMWEALENALTLVAPDGLFCVALYNRPGRLGFHMAVKRLYNRSPQLLSGTLVWLYTVAWSARQLLAGRNPISYIRNYSGRGMSFRRDVEDWLGGLPFEFTDESELRGFVEPRGFEVVRVVTATPGGNNEYLLRRAR